MSLHGLFLLVLGGILMGFIEFCETYDCEITTSLNLDTRRYEITAQFNDGRETYAAITDDEWYDEDMEENV